MKEVRLRLHLSEELLEALRQEAARNRRGLNDQVGWIVEQHVESEARREKSRQEASDFDPFEDSTPEGIDRQFEQAAKLVQHFYTVADGRP